MPDRPSSARPDPAPEIAPPPPTFPPAVKTYARRLVRDNATVCTAMSFVPAPFLGSVGISAFQLHMLAELSRIYGVPFSQNVARAMLAASAGGVLNTLIAGNPVTGAVRDFMTATMPLIALPVRLIAGPALMAAYTYILGHAFIRHYEQGGKYIDFDWKNFRRELTVKLGLPRPALPTPAQT